MAKQSGLGDNLYVDEFDISGDIMAVDSVGPSRGVLPATGIDKSAMERMQGIKDGTLEITTFFNDATGAVFPTLKAVTSSDRIATYCRGTSLGSPACSGVSKQMDLNVSRPDDGSLTIATSMLPNGYGMEWGRLGTAGKRTDTTATNGTSIDDGAGVGTTAFGLQMYVHLFAFTGTSVTIKVQSSTDNGAGDAFADITGATTGALTAVGKVRIATGASASVERYLRVVTTGTFSNAQFAVNIVRNLATPVF